MDLTQNNVRVVFLYNNEEIDYYDYLKFVHNQHKINVEENQETPPDIDVPVNKNDKPKRTVKTKAKKLIKKFCHKIVKEETETPSKEATKFIMLNGLSKNSTKKHTTTQLPAKINKKKTPRPDNELNIANGQQGKYVLAPKQQPAKKKISPISFYKNEMNRILDIQEMHWPSKWKSMVTKFKKNKVAPL